MVGQIVTLGVRPHEEVVTSSKKRWGKCFKSNITAFLFIIIYLIDFL